MGVLSYLGAWSCPGKPEFHPEVPLIEIECLSFPGEIHLVVVERCSGGLHPPDELLFLIDEDVQLGPKGRLLPFLRPGAVSAQSALRPVFPWRIGRGMSGIGGDEGRVLDHPLSDRETLSHPAAVAVPLRLPSPARFGSVVPGRT